MILDNTQDLNFSDLITNAWQQRLERRLEDCYVSTSYLKHLFQIKDKKEFNHDYLALECLNVSLFRAQNKIEQSIDALSEIEKNFDTSVYLTSFYYLYEKAYVYFNQGDYTKAIEYFVSASQAKHPQSNTNRCIAQTNIALCFDHLNMNFEPQIEQIKLSLKNINSTKIRSLIERQIMSLEYHSHFRRGDIDFFLNSSSEDSIYDQPSYYYQWILALPYINRQPQTAYQNVQYQDSTQYKGAGSFRLRTLTGDLHPDDFLIQNPFEFVDRLYLWIWRHLTDPNNASLDTILAIIKHLIFEKQIYQLTIEDRKLLKCSFLWLIFMDQCLDLSAIKNWLQKLDPGSQYDMPLLDFEALIIQWLIALKENQTSIANEYLKAIKNNPLFLHQNHLLSEIVKGVIDPNFECNIKIKTLCDRIHSNLKNQNPSLDVITVNKETGEIFNPHNDKKSISQVTAKALYLLSKQDVISCEYFVRSCFGIKRYFHSIHGPKIFNLLARVRNICGESYRATIKDSLIYTTDDFKKIEFIGFTGSEEPLSHIEDWHTILGEISQQRSNQKIYFTNKIQSQRKEPIRFKLGEVLKRQDLEIRLEKSRSTTSRLIDKWVKDGILKRQGFGKRTNYTFMQNLDQSI